MPALKTEDVAQKGKTDVQKMMQERLDLVEGATKDIGDDWSQIDRETGEKLRTANEDLAILGERFDEIQEAEGWKDRATKLSEFLNKPIGELPLDGGQKPKQGREPTDFGYLFANSDAVKAFNETGQKGIDVEIPTERFGFDLFGVKEPNPHGMKATLGTDDSLSDVDTQYAPQAIRLPGVVETLYQTPNISDLFPQGSTTQNAIPYMVETVSDTGAAEVAEGAAASEASIDFAESSAAVRKIAVGLPVTEEGFADAPFLRSYVNARLGDFLSLREDSQLLNGDGSAPNLEGILNVTGISDQAEGSDDLEAAAYKAMTQVREAFMEPSAVVMAAATWQTIRLRTTTDGVYIFGSPADAGPQRLWGVPVVVNQNMPAHSTGNTSVLVGAFATGGMIFRRQSISLAITDSDGSNFLAGILTVKATMREAFPVFRPAAFCTVTAA